MQEDWLGIVAVIHERDTCDLVPSRSSGGDSTWSKSGYFLKVESSWFVGRLNMVYEREKEVSSDPEISTRVAEKMEISWTEMRQFVNYPQDR